MAFRLFASARSAPNAEGENIIPPNAESGSNPAAESTPKKNSSSTKSTPRKSRNQPAAADGVAELPTTPKKSNKEMRKQLEADLARLSTPKDQGKLTPAGHKPRERRTLLTRASDTPVAEKTNMVVGPQLDHAAVAELNVRNHTLTIPLVAPVEGGVGSMLKEIGSVFGIKDKQLEINIAFGTTNEKKELAPGYRPVEVGYLESHNGQELARLSSPDSLISKRIAILGNDHTAITLCGGHVEHLYDIMISYNEYDLPLIAKFATMAQKELPNQMLLALQEFISKLPALHEDIVNRVKALDGVLKTLGWQFGRRPDQQATFANNLQMPGAVGWKNMVSLDTCIEALSGKLVEWQLICLLLCIDDKKKPWFVGRGLASVPRWNAEDLVLDRSQNLQSVLAWSYLRHGIKPVNNITRALLESCSSKRESPLWKCYVEYGWAKLAATYLFTANDLSHRVAEFASVLEFHARQAAAVPLMLTGLLPDTEPSSCALEMRGTAIARAVAQAHQQPFLYVLWHPFVPGDERAVRQREHDHELHLRDLMDIARKCVDARLNKVIAETHAANHADRSAKSTNKRPAENENEKNKTKRIKKD